MREYRIIDRNTKKLIPVTFPVAMMSLDGRFFHYNAAGQFIDMTEHVIINQAVGLNAQNGKTRVFEDDIVEADVEVRFLGPEDPPMRLKVVGIVRYDYHMSGFGLDIIDQDITHLLVNGCRWFVMRVMGDIHRNPELLAQYKKTSIHV